MKNKLILIFLLTISAGSLYAQNCSNTSTGYLPVNDIGTGFWRAKQGGLYPNGLNYIPAAHFNAGMQIASQNIKPLDTNGNYDPVNGKIVLLSIGLSNTTQEFSRFIEIANSSGVLNSKLKIIDGAQGGQHINIIIDSNAAFWTTIVTRLKQNGLSSRQVQAIWFKEAEASPSDSSFPGYALSLKNKFKQVMNILVNKYPNVRLCYNSSRIYAGYSSSNLNPEPYAYYSGWSVKWMIEDQINGDTLLTFTGSNRKSPWLAWGPYLWADGMISRSDGLIWRCPVDYQSDGTHPSDSGKTKVANLLFNFFRNDSTSKSWFLSNLTGINIEPILKLDFNLYQNYPNPFNPSTHINYYLPKSSYVTLKIYTLVGKEIATVVNERQNSGNYSIEFNTANYNLPSGIYFYRLETNDLSETRKMILLK
ncbi:hypothetical protein BH10BAC5_BH10BAC5_23330 [soil metagenome]